jgi:hypothetical protein
MDNGVAANGPYDLQFSLYDADTGGSERTAGFAYHNVDVIDGSFTVALDFGPEVFDGSSLWLEIGVKPGGEDSPLAPFTILSPRQEIMPMPYALFAMNGSGAGSGWIISGGDIHSGVPGNVGIGTSSPRSKLDVAGHVNSSESYKLGGETVLANYGTGNIFVGGGAGVSNITGTGNSATGWYALHQNSTGQANSAAGSLALFKNTTGWGNSAMGRCALYENTTGNYNSAMGFDALYSNTTGTENSAVGANALYFNTTGNYNSAMGRSALLHNTTGNYNTAVGFAAGLSNSTGDRNVFLGYQAGRQNTTGTLNTFSGCFAGDNNTTGSENTFSGCQAGLYNTTGNDNVFAGNEAGSFNSTGNNNTCVGAHAGQALRQGSGNVFIGYQAGFSETDSNKLYIANSSGDPLIYGDFSTGFIGIGTKYRPDGGKVTIVGDEIRTLTVINSCPLYGGTDGSAICGYARGTGFGCGGFFAADVGWGVHGEAKGDKSIGVDGEAEGMSAIGVRGYAFGYGGSKKVMGGYFEGEDSCARGVYAKAGYAGGIGVCAYGGPSGGYDFYAEGPGEDYGSASSIRWKTDIRPINEAIDKVMRLRGVYFNWDAQHGGGHDVGMIAEEVGQVLPEIVVYEPNSVYATGMDYSMLTPLLVEAVKELKAEVDKKDQKISQLAERVSQLESLCKENADLHDRLTRLESVVGQVAQMREGGLK